MGKLKLIAKAVLAIVLYYVAFLAIEKTGIPIKGDAYIIGIFTGFLIVTLIDLLPIVGLRSFTRLYYYTLLFYQEKDLFDQENIFKAPVLRSGLIWAISLSIPYFWLITISVVVFKIWKRKGILSIPAISNRSLSENSFQLYFKNGKLSIDNVFRGIFISGGAGSGKSKSIIEPLIHQAGEKDFTGIVYDYKFPTLAEEVNGSFLEKSRLKKYFVNFTDLTTSHRVNPLHPILLTNSNYARELASSVIFNLDPEAIKKKDFWTQSAEALLTGTIWFLQQEYPENCTLPHAISILLNAPSGEQLIQTLKQNEQVSGIISGIESSLASEKTSASIFSTVRTLLSSLFTEEVYWVLGDVEGDFTLDINNPKDPKMVVLGNNPSLSNTFSPLISLIITSALKQMNQLGKSNSIVLLDEAPTLFIPRFDEIPATARSNKIATVYCAQDISQMEDRYGLTKAETIISNLGNQFYGRTTNIKTAERVSKMFGKYEREFESRSQSFNQKADASLSRSISVQQRDRVEPQQIMRLETGEFYGVLAEGSNLEFGTKFLAEESKSRSLPKIYKDLHHHVITSNFKKINTEAIEIVNQVSLNENKLNITF